MTTEDANMITALKQWAEDEVVKEMSANGIDRIPALLLTSLFIGMEVGRNQRPAAERVLGTMISNDFSKRKLASAAREMLAFVMGTEKEQSNG